MFAYNELSDLITGELVTPIKKNGDKIICLNSNYEEVEYSFEDFDFDKTVEERVFTTEENIEDYIEIDDTSSDEEPQAAIEVPEEKKEPKEYSFDSDNDPHWLDKGDAELIAHQFGYKATNNIKSMKEFDMEITSY